MLPPTKGASDLGAMAGCLLFVGTLVVSLRLYARKVQQTKPGADDYVMIGAFLCFVGTITTVFFGIAHKIYGFPTGTPGASSGYTLRKVYISFDLLSTPCIGLVKVSALLFFQRIFCVSKQWTAFRIITTVWLVFTSCWTVAYTIIPLFQCGPNLDDLWSRSRCPLAFQWLVSSTIIDFFLEVTILVMPIPMILKLHTNLRRKIGLILIFATAIASLGASIGRLVIFRKTVEEVNKASKTTDYNLLNTQDVYMNLLEAGMTLIAANMPSLYFLRNGAVPKKFLHGIKSIMSLRTRSSDDKSSNKAVTTFRKTHGQGKDLESGRRSDDAGFESKRNGSDSSTLPMIEASLSLVPKSAAFKTMHATVETSGVSENRRNLRDNAIYINQDFDQQVTEVRIDPYTGPRATEKGYI